MMSKVLSDILDFNRMDEGRLATVERPFRFHNALKSMLPGARIVANSRGLEVIEDFDPNIDLIARSTLMATHGLSEADIQARLADPENPSDGVVSGDEMRIRQVITNFLSNALKFGVGARGSGPGKVTLRTRLISPAPKSGDCPSENMSLCSSGGSEPTGVQERKDKDRKLRRRLDAIVVRVEVEDTGMFALCRLRQASTNASLCRCRDSVQRYGKPPPVLCKSTTDSSFG